MKEKKNEFWWLDLLEVKFTNVTPRFGFTKKLINAHNNSHLLKKLPGTRNEALTQIHALKSDLFHKKYHGAHKKLVREVSRVFKLQRSKAERSEQLEALFNNKEFVGQLVSSKLAKIITTAIIPSKQLKENPPSYFPKEVVSILSDKTNPCNPTAFYIKYCQANKLVNGYVSKLWNIKELKTLCNEIDWTFRKIRGNLTKEEVAQHAKTAPAKDKSKSKSKNGKNGDLSDDSSESDDDLDEEGFEFDGMIANSDDEDLDQDNSAGEESEPENDTNGIESQHEKEKKEKAEKKAKQLERKLPQLATGYFSGGSDDDEDVDNDSVVKEATTVRKNRRGQRARQKIWEAKYGSKANHVQQENIRIASERERKQKEFEERQRRRDLKAQAAASGQDGNKHNSKDPNKLHPSWEAKKLAEQKQKDIKFTGKKITFD